MPKIINDVRNQLIRETRKILIEDRGIKKLTLRRVAYGCNVSIGLIYNYFENKLDLVSAVMQEDWLAREKEYDDNSPYDSPKKAIEELYRHVHEFACTYDCVWNEYLETKGVNPGDEKFVNFRKQFVEELEGLLKPTFDKKGKPSDVKKIRFFAMYIAKFARDPDLEFDEFKDIVLSLLK